MVQKKTHNCPIFSTKWHMKQGPMKYIKGLLAFLGILCLSGSVPIPETGKKINNSLDTGSDFDKILLVERHAIKSTHVYTYHQEDNNLDIPPEYASYNLQ